MEYLFMSFQINKTCIYNAFVNTVKNAGLEMLEKGNNFNILWTSYVIKDDII